jgi:SAM-dependent methyltransferase
MFEEFELYKTCPICGSNSFELKRAADCSGYRLYKEPLSTQIRWMECQNCLHGFREGFYTKAAFDVLFQTSHPGQRVGEDYERQRIVASKLIDRVLPHQDSGIWLDVGFGNGALLLTAVEYGFKPIGVDLRQQNVDGLKKLGVQAELLDFTSANLNPKASVISMCDVLEHIQFPILALQSAYRNLISGGVLFLSMPNSDSPVWKLLDAASANPYWAEMEHFHNFGRVLLYKILKETGFTPVKYGISERYRACMEVVAIRDNEAGAKD